MQPSAVVRRRLRSQRLATPTLARPEDVVAWFGAVQAQDFAAAKWAIGQRTTGATDATVEQAFDDGRILRTHVLRPTWHFVLPADIRWMLALSAARIDRACASRHRELGLDAATFDRGRVVLTDALQGGRQLTRPELTAALRSARVIGADASGMAHLLMRAELDAVITSGAMRGKHHTYALLEERAPAATPVTRDAALAILARRFFTSHGPATLKDFAWWSGLTRADAAAGVDLAGSALVRDAEWLFAPPGAGRGASRAHLLPNYDEYLVAYADRGAVCDARYVSRGARGSVLFDHTIVVNGQVVGTWKRRLTASAVTIETTRFRKLTRSEMTAVTAAAERYGAFLARSVRIE